MATYGFRCECGIYTEVDRPMADATQPLRCQCGKSMQRIFHPPLVTVRPDAGAVMDRALAGEEVPPGWSKEKTMATARSMTKDKGKSLREYTEALTRTGVG